MAGRPCEFTQDIADRICARLAEGISLRTVCKADDMPDASTVFRWLRTKPEFCEQYTRAKDESADALTDEMLDIADDARNDWMEHQVGEGVTAYQVNGEHIQRSRLRIETRKWLASKFKPKKYGDKVDLTHSAPDGGPVAVEFHIVDHRPKAQD